jgi:hypothetical protein
MHRIPDRFRWAALAALLPGLVAVLVPLTGRANERNASYLAALNSITAGELQGHVEYLADDRLEGRQPGKPGGRAAGAYLAEQFARLELQGAGDDGGYFQCFPPKCRNVLAVLRGSDPKLKRELVVVGAHYDHIGYGYGPDGKKFSRGPVGHVHNGADDNASGTAVVVELAEALALLAEPPKRTVLFACFDAEETGMNGSQHWVKHPNVPLQHVAAMINFDMVGRLRDERLTVFGTRTGCGLRRLVCLAGAGSGPSLDFSWDFRANTDHYMFFERQVPVLFFHTGMHEQYHTPHDDPETINRQGMQQVARLAFGVVYELTDRPERLRFRPQAGEEHNGTRGRELRRRPKLADRLGVAWRPGKNDGEGVVVSRVTRGSPASQANLEPGDRIVRFAEREIRDGADLRAAVMTAPSEATLYVRRGERDEPLRLSVELDHEPVRLGVTWRTDEADPGGIILTHVIPRTPADQAGLQPGDRIYRVGDRDVTGEAEFVRLVRTLTGRVELLVERDGRVRTVVVHLDAPPLAKAA